MITTDTDDLFERLDPAHWAADALGMAGRAINAYDAEVGPWTDRTGELRRSFTFAVDGDTLTVSNEADHAAYVENREGYSVLTAVVDGAAERLVGEAVTQAMDRLPTDRVPTDRQVSP